MTDEDRRQAWAGERTSEDVERNLQRAEARWRRAQAEMRASEEDVRRWQALALQHRQRPDGVTPPHVRIEGRPGPAWRAGGDLDYFEDVTVLEGDGSTLFATFHPDASPLPLLPLAPGTRLEVWGQARDIEDAVRRVGGRVDVVGRQ